MKAFVFPGQGSQFKGMGQGLFDKYPKEIDIANDILEYSIVDLCLRDLSQQLHQTQYTQPALYVVNALSYKDKVAELGAEPDYLAGHSLGEYNALQASGAIVFEDGLKLVKKRGDLMSRAPKGAMAAILGSTEEKIRQLLIQYELPGVDIANYNSPDQTVVSGLEEDINRAEILFGKEGIKFIPLNTSGAFHSRYMKASEAEFNKYLQTFAFSDLKIPVISNVHARPYKKDEIVNNLSAQISNSVKWSESIQYLISKGEMEFCEIGVGVVLTTLIDKIREQQSLQNSQIENVIESNSKRESGGAFDSENIDSNITSTSNIGRELNTTDIDNIQMVISNWNETYPIGTKVSVKNNSEIFETRSEAIVLFGKKPAIYMKGYKGYFDLTEVKPQINENTI